MSRYWASSSGFSESPRCKKVHVMAFPDGRLVNKSRDIQNASETSHIMRAVSIWTLSYISKPWKLTLCDLIWQIIFSYNRLDGSHCDETGHHKMAVLGVAGGHGNNPWKFHSYVIVSEPKFGLYPV